MKLQKNMYQYSMTSALFLEHGHLTMVSWYKDNKCKKTTLLKTLLFRSLEIGRNNIITPEWCYPDWQLANT